MEISSLFSKENEMTETLRRPSCSCQVLRQLFSHLGCGIGAVSPAMLCESCQEELRTTPRALSYGEGTSFDFGAVACWNSVDPDGTHPVRTRWILSKVSLRAKQNQPLQGALEQAFRDALHKTCWVVKKR